MFSERGIADDINKAPLSDEDISILIEKKRKELEKKDIILLLYDYKNKELPKITVKSEGQSYKLIKGPNQEDVSILSQEELSSWLRDTLLSKEKELLQEQKLKNRLEKNV